MKTAPYVSENGLVFGWLVSKVTFRYLAVVLLRTTLTASAGPSMSPNGARAGYFLSKFEPGGSHEGWLTPAELRLIAEWLDIGAQYYNDPFAVPAD